ncbi:MAG TPA: phage terminase small subunit [Candidatus Sulfotelmatobacter sp.]|jgi:hypothetical protein|nr:phage terminase small subunit [Candidatus Sulfotelmatobacter sp.]
MSIARAHFMRVAASLEIQEAATGEAPAPGSMYEKMLGQLRIHQAHLKTIQSRAAKIEAKRGMLPDFDAYCEGVIAGGSGAQDDVLAFVMLWRLDVGDWNGALEIGAYGVRFDLAMPAPLSRDLPTTLLEEISDAALASPTPDSALAEHINSALLLTTDSDMPDEVRAKGHKALGLLAMENDPAQAVVHFEAALSLDPKCGVKTQLTRARKASTPAGS